MTAPTPVGDLSTLIPHAQRMCLLETVEHWDDNGIRCSTRTHLDPLNPLRSRDQLAALHLCEYGAQAMALHGGLVARRDHGGPAAPGLLAGLRQVELAVERIDDIDGPLTVIANRKLAGPDGWLYEFEVSAGGRRLARGRVTVIPRPGD